MFPLRVICGILLAQSYVFAVSNTDSRTCDSPIYCEGPLLHAVQLAKLYPDSKTFVDMPTKVSESEVLAAFNKIGGENASNEDIQQFVDDHFLPPAYELERFDIETPELEWINNIEDPVYSGWLQELNYAWKNLTFQFNTDVLCEDCVTSILPTKRPFVVPGGRFREFYYWDSYFVIKGLLLSEKTDLARNMIENFFDFVEKYGFIPNGARIYYLNRSQPPFLTQMVKDYFEKTGDVDFIEHALPILEKEYQFWLTNTTVTIKDASCDEEFQLNHYVTSNTSPRPESYTEDYLTVNQDTDYTDATKRQMYADIAAGAETGWDYSSRWTREKAPSPDQKENYEMLRSIETSNIIPIDLNALLWSMETNLALWSEKYGSRVRGARNTKYYKRQAKKRLRAMNTLMWNDEDHTYYDFNLTANAQSIEFTPANLFPFWLGALPKDKSALPYVFDQTEQALRKYPGILTSSLYNTSMQWDYPNGWPPQTYVALEAMLNINKQLDNQGVTGHGTSISHLAKVLADRYTASAFCGWYRTGGTIPGVLNKLSDSTDDDGHMFEKFDVNTIGVSGSQGEYVSQTGFGWTNGVAMWIFDQFENMVAPDCSTDVRYDI